MKNLEVKNNETKNTPSLLTCALHGAIGLIIGFGIGMPTALLVSVILQSADYFVILLFVIMSTIYGAYLGFAFREKKEAFNLAKAGFFAGIVSSVIYALVNSLNLRDVLTIQVLISAIAFSILGISFGYPDKNKILKLAVYGFIGGAIGSTLVYSNLEIGYFVEETIGRPTGVFSIMFTIIMGLAISGASLSIGRYYNKTKKTELKTSKVDSLEIIGVVGIMFALFVLFMYGIFVLSGPTYYYSSNSIVLDVSKELQLFQIEKIAKDSGYQAEIIRTRGVNPPPLKGVDEVLGDDYTVSMLILFHSDGSCNFNFYEGYTPVSCFGAKKEWLANMLEIGFHINKFEASNLANEVLESYKSVKVNKNFDFQAFHNHLREKGSFNITGGPTYKNINYFNSTRRIGRLQVSNSYLRITHSDQNATYRLDLDRLGYLSVNIELHSREDIDIPRSERIETIKKILETLGLQKKGLENLEFQKFHGD